MNSSLLSVLRILISQTLLTLEVVGVIGIDNLRQFNHGLRQDFDLRMRIIAYWKIVQRRLVDSMALFLLFSVQNLVNRELKVEIVNGLIGPQGSGIEWMLGDIPSVTAKREKLERSKASEGVS